MLGLTSTRPARSDLLDLQNNSTVVTQITNTGAALFKNSTNSTTAFQIQTATGGNLLTADASNQQIIIGVSGSSTPVGLSIPGTGTADASTPDSVANSITGDIDLIAKIQPNDWSPAIADTIISKYASTTTQYSYNFSLATAGKLNLGLSNSGTAATTATSSVATGYVNGTAHWVRVTWQASTGTVQFFTGEDGINWTQLGTNQTISNVTVPSIFDSTANVNIGAAATANNTNVFNGTIYRAKLYSGFSSSGGTLENDFNPADAASLSSTSWTSSEYDR